MIGSVIGGGAGALGGLFGGISKNKMIQKQIEMINQRKQENQNWYDRRYNEDSTQRADAQRLLTLTEESIRKRNKATAGREAVMGGASEQSAQEKEQNNKMLSDAVSQINVAGEKRKEQIEQQYQARKDALNDTLANLESQKKDAFDIMSDMIGGAANGMSLGI